MKDIKVKITFTEEVLGTSPIDKEIYKTYVASKAPDAKSMKEEVEAFGIDEVADKPRTVFGTNSDGELIFWNYQIKGFFKDACGMLRKVSTSKSSKLTSYKKVIDGLVFVEPRQIEIENIVDVGNCERPLRASTPQGDRVAIAVSDTVNSGATLTFTVHLMQESLEGALLEWLDYGKWRGLGQWRNSGKGTFTYEILS